MTKISGVARRRLKVKKVTATLKEIERQISNRLAYAPFRIEGKQDVNEPEIVSPTKSKRINASKSPSPLVPLGASQAGNIPKPRQIVTPSSQNHHSILNNLASTAGELSESEEDVQSEFEEECSAIEDKSDDEVDQESDSLEEFSDSDP